MARVMFGMSQSTRVDGMIIIVPDNEATGDYFAQIKEHPEFLNWVNRMYQTVSDDPAEDMVVVEYRDRRILDFIRELEPGTIYDGLIHDDWQRPI